MRLEEIARAKALDCDTIEIWFADEARIGQKNKITRRWATRGTIVAWSTANRRLMLMPINDNPAAAWPRPTPGRNWVVLDVEAPDGGTD